MRIFANYIKSRLPRYILWAASLGIFYTVIRLSTDSIPGYAVKYGFILSAFFAAVYTAADFYVYRRRIKQLQNIINDITLARESLPSPADGIQQGYDELIQKLLDENTDLKNEADRKLSDMSDYYTMWAHQIKTPISAMKLILQTEDTEVCSELEENLRSIELYVEMVMCYIRLESVSSDYVICEYDIDGIIRATVKKFASQFIRKKIKLIYEPTGLKFYTDSKWFGFILGQVISNSLKYTKHGSVRIYAENPDTLCIADTGTGIAPEDLPRIFEKGYTGCNGRSEMRSSGLGLYLCKTICGRLRHSITVFSDESGTTVKICAKTYSFIAE